MAARSVSSRAPRALALPIPALVAGLVAALGVSAIPASAQRIAERIAESTRDVRRVSVQLDSARLSTALEVVAREAGLVPAYDATLLPAHVRVTLHLRDVTVSDAFQQVLAGTALTAEVRTGGNVIIVRTRAQASGIITGFVRHAKTKAPIANATITLDDAPKGVSSDETGAFRIATSAGEHVVHLRVLGMQKQSKRLSVPDGKPVAVEFLAEPTTSVLDEVVVTGTVVATERKAVTTPITVITADEIEKRGITRVDQLFRGEVPGVLALERGTQAYGDNLGDMSTARVYSRGSTALNGSENPIKTYVDGVELLNSTYLGTIDPKTIERIEIITGPQAATIYGSGAMGGVMQIFTKRGSGHTTPDFTLNVKYGLLQNSLTPSYTPSHNHSLLMAGGSGPEFSYSGNLSYQYTGQWQPALFARTSGASIGATHTRGPVVVGGSVSLTAGKNGTSVSDLSQSTYGTTANYSTLYYDKFMSSGDVEREMWSGGRLRHRVSMSSSQMLAFNTDYRASSIWQHHLTLGRAQNNLSLVPEQPAYMNSADTLFATRWSKGQRTTANYNMTVLPRLGPISASMTLGGNASWSDLSSLDACLLSNEATAYVGCSAGNTPNVSRTVNDDNWGGFGSWQLGFFDQLFFTVGLRGERNPSYGRDHKVDWTPTTGVSYTIEHGPLTLKLLASYGSATRPPTPTQRQQELVINGQYDPAQYLRQFESPHLTPEYSHGPQGGLELYYGNVGSLTINRYVQTVTDLIQSVLVDSVYINWTQFGVGWWQPQWQYINAASLRQHGWEGTASLNLRAFSLKGTYSWSDSRVTALSAKGINVSGTFAYEPGTSMVGLPTHSASVSAGYALGGTSISWVTNYVGSSLQQRHYDPAWILTNYSRLQMYMPRNGKYYHLISSPGYAKSDLALSHRLSPWASALLNVTNVTNDFSSDVSALFPSLGRQTLMGISLRFPGR